MTTIDFITELFSMVDDKVDDDKHPQAKLYPSEVAPWICCMLSKDADSAPPAPDSYNQWWLTWDCRHLFHALPDRTHLFRLFDIHRHYVDQFLADPSLIGVIDTYGIELLHPIREGRSDNRLGKKGKSNHRWIVGGKQCYLLNHLGLVVSSSCDTANVYDGSAFQHMVDNVADQTVVFSNTGFEKKGWNPANLCICQRGEWNVRMLVKTVMSMLTMSVISSILATNHGITSRPKWDSQWLCSIYWFSGTDFSLMKVVSFPYQ